MWRQTVSNDPSTVHSLVSPTDFADAFLTWGLTRGWQVFHCRVAERSYVVLL